MTSTSLFWGERKGGKLRPEFLEPNTFYSEFTKNSRNSYITINSVGAINGIAVIFYTKGGPSLLDIQSKVFNRESI